MVYKFRIISDEVDDFLREIKIDSEATFYDLHEAILKCTGYKDDQMTSFFICDDAERVLFIERSEIITGKDLQHATCSRKEGNPPKQTIDFDEQMNTNTALDLDENFYGDQDFDMEDFDPEGFDMEGGSNPYDEDKY